ncbi:MAG: 50S ribosomal protein L21 [Candidatus Kerfeldbacteria bacterium]|nr:50S ribosomal protein L21 [Candidatus Kerfeldbacteria bacterium]
MTFAVIKTGGKQYFVKEGKTVRVEKLGEMATGATVSFPDILMVGSDDGSDVKIGTPVVSGAQVTGTVSNTGRGKKITVVKYKAKTRYRRTRGHRQSFTEVRIEKIQG